MLRGQGGRGQLGGTGRQGGRRGKTTVRESNFGAGTTVIVHAYVYQVGRQTAYIKGWMTSEDGKTTYAVCDHHKIHVPTPAEHMALRVPWDDQWDEEGKEKKTAAKL